MIELVLILKTMLKLHLASSLALAASDLPLVVDVLLFATPVVAFFAFGFDVDVVFFSGAWMRIVSIMGIFEFALQPIALFPFETLSPPSPLHFAGCSFDQGVPSLHSFTLLFHICIDLNQIFPSHSCDLNIISQITLIKLAHIAFYLRCFNEDYLP